MRSIHVPSSAIAAVTTAALLLFAQPATAQVHDGVSAAPIDCSQVSSMMDPAKMAAPPAMTGDVDRDTTAAMQMHMAMVMQMAKIEASCGKDPKKEAAAKKVMSDATELVNAIQHLSSPY